MRPATTSASSSPAPAGTRLMMRQAIAALAHGPDHADDLVARPVELAHEVVTDSSIGTDHVARGITAHLPRLGSGAVLVVDDRKGDGNLLREPRDPLPGLAHVHGDHVETRGAEARLEAIERGHLVAAGLAPGRP